MALSRNQIIGAVSSVFVLPGFILTVVPTLSRDPGTAICMALGVIALPFLPFALRQCKDTGSRVLVIVLGLLVLAYNFQNTLDALNRGHAADTGVVRGRMTSADHFKARIAGLEERRRDVDAKTREVVDAAQRARDSECKTGYGPKCRDRETALANAQRDRTDRVAKVDADMDEAQAGLAKLGAVEKTADQTASQLAGFAALFWAPAAASGDAISTNRPIFKTLVVETMNGLMPWIMVMIFGTAAPLPKVRSRKAVKNDPTKESVLAWHKDRVVRRAGRSVRAGVAYKDYCTWCEAGGQAPVNQTEFGKIVSGELGIQKTASGTRTSYTGIGLMKVVQTTNPCKTPAKGLRKMGILGRLWPLPLKI